MSNISSYNSNSISSLFSNFSNNNSQTGSTNFLGINLSDYNSIRSGSYGKLLKNYYADSGFSGNVGSSASTSTSKASTQALAQVESKAEGVKAAADKLLKKGKDSLFEKTDIKDADGKTTTGYDTDKIYKAVNDFVEKYNSLIESTAESNVTGILTNASSMVKATKVNEGMLKTLGITIGSDNKLSINEETFKKANMETVKSMFNTTGSYGYQMSAKSSMIDFYAQNEATKANTYSKSGMYTYNFNTGNIYNSET